HQPALAVEGHAVGMVGGMDQHLLADARRPLPDGVADDIDPQESLVAPIPYRTFAEIEPVGDGVERRIGAGDPLEAGCREVDVHLAASYGRLAMKSISTRAPLARPVTPMQVRAGRLFGGKYEA